MKRSDLQLPLVVCLVWVLAVGAARSEDVGRLSRALEIKKLELQRAMTFLVREGTGPVLVPMLLEARCRMAAGRRQAPCRSGALLAGATLDFRNPIAFHTQTLRLITDPEATRYLRRIGDGEYRAKGLWEFTVGFHNGDREKALQWIALLLQDTGTYSIEAILKSRSATYGIKAPQVSPEFLESLHAANERVHNEPNPGLLYPSEVGNQSRNWVTSQYHFYVIAYWAFLLRNAGMAESYSGLIPYLFNQTYEIGHAGIESVDFQFLAEVTFGPLPFRRDTRGLDFWMDSYSGYTGARWGAALIDSQVGRALPPIRCFQDAYALGARAVFESFFENRSLCE